MVERKRAQTDERRRAKTDERERAKTDDPVDVANAVEPVPEEAR
jgi:hypothetical protein